MKTHALNFLLVCLVAAAQCLVQALALATSLQHRRTTPSLAAGGFVWEDPGEAFDLGIENPFKKAELLEEGLNIDPA